MIPGDIKSDGYPSNANLFAKHGMDVFAWLSNVLSSILIIFLTKLVMAVYGFKVCHQNRIACNQWPRGFFVPLLCFHGIAMCTNMSLPHCAPMQFATTICGMHFMSCAIAIRASSTLGYTEHVPIPLFDALLFSVIGSVSISSANLSLMFNTVGFYQIAKLLLAPFVCVIESLFFGKRFTTPVLLSIAVTLIGVGIVTVSDVQSNLMGTVMAIVFVVSSGLQQIL